jgi:hypothetical protein
MNYGLDNCALSSYISASKGVKVFLLGQFRIELLKSKKHFQEMFLILDGNAEAKLLRFDGIFALCFCQQAGLFGHLLRLCRLT